MFFYVVDVEVKFGLINVCVVSEVNKLFFKNDIDKKFIGFLFNGMDEFVEDNEGLVEDVEEFMFDLNNDGDLFFFNFGKIICFFVEDLNFLLRKLYKVFDNLICYFR